MKIVHVPNKILYQKSKPVKQFDKKLDRIIIEMKKALEAQNNPPGVGLAAPQVGLPLQIFLTKPKKNSSIRVFINPVIVASLKPTKNNPDKKPVKSRKSKKNARLEGCLSIPLMWGAVQRAPKLSLSYQDEQGKTHSADFSGFESIIIQHEVDHLNGVLFTQRVMEQGNTLYLEKEGELNEYPI